MQAERGLTSPARRNARTWVPRRSGSIARPSLAQNSICPAMERSASSRGEPSVEDQLVGELHGLTDDAKVALCYQDVKSGRGVPCDHPPRKPEGLRSRRTARTGYRSVFLLLLMAPPMKSKTTSWVVVSDKVVEDQYQSGPVSKTGSVEGL